MKWLIPPIFPEDIIEAIYFHLLSFHKRGQQTLYFVFVILSLYVQHSTGVDIDSALCQHAGQSHKFILHVEKY